MSYTCSWAVTWWLPEGELKGNCGRVMEMYAGTRLSCSSPVDFYTLFTHHCHSQQLLWDLASTDEGSLTVPRLASCDYLHFMQYPIHYRRRKRKKSSPTLHFFFKQMVKGMRPNSNRSLSEKYADGSCMICGWKVPAFNSWWRQRPSVALPYSPRFPLTIMVAKWRANSLHDNFKYTQSKIKKRCSTYISLDVNFCRR